MKEMRKVEETREKGSLERKVEIFMGMNEVCWVKVRKRRVMKRKKMRKVEKREKEGERREFRGKGR